MRVVVFGAVGFIGTNICKHLLKRGDHVVGVDNLFTGTVSNLAQLRQFENFSFVQHDVRSPIPFVGTADVALNLACPASPPKYMADTQLTLDTCYIGINNILDFCDRFLIRHGTLVHASTSEIYGDPLVHPQSEKYWGNTNPIGPRSCYDEGKRIAETILYCKSQNEVGNDLRIRVARIFNTYGPYMDPFDGRVVTNTLTSLILNKPVEIYGDGSQTRSFCFVDDLVEGIIKLIECNSKVHFDVFNLGNPVETTVNSLVAEAEKVFGNSAKIMKKNLPIDDPLKRKPDITKMTKMYNWRPKTGLKEGLASTRDYIEKALGLVE